MGWLIDVTTDYLATGASLSGFATENRVEAYAEEVYPVTIVGA